MAFVRWHYRRNGVYVRSHHRRATARRCERQGSLLPTVLPTAPRADDRTTAQPVDLLPALPVPGQRQLPIGA